MIEVRGLTKRYGDFTAVRDLTFTVRPGEVMGLVGPNGAGKTTTLRCATGIIPPTLGQVRIAGIDLAISPKRELRRRLDALRPDAIHIATEGPLGWAARGYSPLRRWRISLPGLK